MLTVQCPRCGSQQRTDPRGAVIRSVKRCVYCGRSFRIHAGAADTRVVRTDGGLVSWQAREPQGR